MPFKQEKAKGTLLRSFLCYGGQVEHRAEG